MLAERVKEWTREWKEEGLQQGMRDMVLDAIETKFGRSSERFRTQISQINDRLRLKEIHRMVLKAQDIEDFEKALGN